MDRKSCAGGIAERMAALQKSGEENWKKKVPRLVDNKNAHPVMDILNSNNAVNLNVCDKENNQVPGGNESLTLANGRPVSIRDRQDKLQQAGDFTPNRNPIKLLDEEESLSEAGVVLRRTAPRPTDDSLLITGEPSRVRPVSIHDRLNKLQVSSQSWQGRVGDKDVSKFTVAGKMQSDSHRSKSTIESPNLLLVEGHRDTPRATSFSPKTPRRVPNEESDLWSSDRVKGTPKPRAFRGLDVDLSQIQASSRSLNNGERKPVMYIEEQLQSDQGMDEFFASLCLPSLQQSPPLFEDGLRPEVLDEFDFDSIQPVDSRPLSMPRKATVKANPNRRRTRNPVKLLSARTDLKVLTTQVPIELEDSPPASPQVELRRNNGNQKQAHLADEAIAGLAAKEDFSAVQLRKSSKMDQCPGMVVEHLPYKPLMLLQVKGRRWCQTRLVEPVAQSINSGDAFVLVTRNKLFNWQGKYANVIEKARSAEIALSICQKHDLGCKAAFKVHTLEQEKLFGTSKAELDFWSLLGEKSMEDEVTFQPRAAGPPEEDEQFELAINDLNLVWEVAIYNGYEELIPVDNFWGCTPKHELLNPAKVLVIDYGPEVYLWNGSNAGFELRKAGLNLLKKVWDSGFDGAHPLMTESHETRPPWGIMGKVNQNMETVLFKEKFQDWPDQAKATRVKPIEVKLAKLIDSNLSGEIDVQPFDADLMHSWVIEDPNLELENSFLGRGRGYYDPSERRKYELETVSLKVHHVNEYNITELADDWRGQFHSEDTYVVRWTYKVSLTGRDLKGRPSKHAAVGRERCCYFFWQGFDSKTTEKGASALMTVEMDREEGPQMRVDQGKEPAAFLNLWQGHMVIHKGRRGQSRHVKAAWRMFILRGECSEEACLVEVPVKAANLRSIASFLLVHPTDGKVIVWQGSSSPEHTQALAIEAAEHIVHTKPLEMGIPPGQHVRMEIDLEGSEGSTCQSALGLPSHRDFENRLAAPTRTPRLFHMSSVATGHFNVMEALCPFRKMDVLNTMPFSQDDLYQADQPALFLLDVGSKLWLWQGYWPEVPEDLTADQHQEENPNSANNNITGSGMIRWHAERRAAMQTAVEYRRLRYGLGSRTPKAELVWAGSEPLTFTNLFPFWKDTREAKKLNEEHVKHSDLEMTLAALSKTEYTWEQLHQSPLPDGVDPAKLERYLSEDEFQSQLGFSKKDFMTFPRWKQIEIRKEKGLF